MVRRHRQDGPGVRHHVMNRAIARRPLFETRRDMRFFLFLLAREVRRGAIRLFAFSLMSTHFHLYVESVDGKLSECMQRIQTTYSRYFNRGRRRDGPLFRGRFSSKPVNTDFYEENLLRYIDHNPVQARLVEHPSEYEFGSAFYRKRRKKTIWLAGCETQSLDENTLSDEEFAEIAFMIEGRLHSPQADSDIDSLVLATPDKIFDWMRMKSLLADGTEPGQPVCSPQTVLNAVALHEHEIRKLANRTGPDEDAILRHITTGMIRVLCGSRLREIAAVTRRTQSATTASWQRYRQIVEEREEVMRLVARVTSTAMNMGPLRQIGLLRIT